MSPRLPLALMLAAVLTGCGGPSAANVELRKKNQQLSEEVAKLRGRADADAAAIAVLQRQAAEGGGTATTAPADRLRQLFMASALRLGRLTGAADLDPARPGNDGLKVYVTPTDFDGDTLKAAGSFLVEATDPTQSPEPLLGRWEFPVERARELWYGKAMLYEYVLPCPWAQPPQAKEARLKVTFVDALTGRTIGPVETKVALAP